MNALISSNLSAIRNLMVRHGVITAFVFGSAAVGNMTDDSDVDFLVSFNPKFDYAEYGENFFQLTYALKDLLKKEVDLVAEETVTNPYFIESINNQKVLVL